MMSKYDTGVRTVGEEEKGQEKKEIEKEIEKRNEKRKRKKRKGSRQSHLWDLGRGTLGVWNEMRSCKSGCLAIVVCTRVVAANRH